MKRVSWLLVLGDPVSSSDMGDSFALYVPRFQVSMFTVRCSAKAKRIHGSRNQDLNFGNRILMLQRQNGCPSRYLVEDLTMRTTHASIEKAESGNVFDTRSERTNDDWRYAYHEKLAQDVKMLHSARDVKSCLLRFASAC